MSEPDEASQPPASPYDQRWLYGPTAAVVAARLAMTQDPKVFAVQPPLDGPPTQIDEEGTEAGFIVVFLRADPPSWPVNLKRALAVIGRNTLGTT